jgi:hypothetical protein
MSEFLGYLQRLKAPPDPDSISAAEKSSLIRHFDPHAADVFVDGVPWDWRNIDEVECVKAARERGPSGWLVKQMLGDDRYHVGMYSGAQEAVVINVSLNVARYIVQTVAYYAPNPVRYKGIEGLSPIANT